MKRKMEVKLNCATGGASRRSWRWRGAAVGAAGVAAALVVGVAPSADAAGTAYVYGDMNVRACASTSCASLGITAYGQYATMYCWEDGGWALGTNRWFYMRVYTTAVTWKSGFINAGGVPTQAKVGHC